MKAKCVREMRRLFAKREPLNLTAVKRRHPELVARVYAVRPFWGWKQALADSGIDYAKVNVELDERCSCRICGGEGAILTTHLLKIHGVTPEEYRKEFPGAELMCERLRAARMRAHASLPHWEPVWSWEYVLDRAWEMHRRGWSLNSVEIQRRDLGMFSFVWHQGWSWDDGRTWDEVLSALGLEPAGIRKSGPRLHLDKKDVIQGLKRRTQEGLSLAFVDVTREDLRLVNAACRRFGSYAKALRAAGFNPDNVSRKLARVTPQHIARVEAEMRRVAAMDGHGRAQAARRLKSRYEAMVFNKLGNWTKACRKFGIKPEDLATHAYASKAQVVRALRAWPNLEAASGNEIGRADRSLASAVYRHFGSWGAAKRAAKVRGG